VKVRATHGKLSALVMQVYLLILRNELKIARFQVRYFRRRNERSSKPVVSRTGGPVVSVTSYGDRLKTVHLLLESIAAGSALPSRLILWVDSPDAYENPTPQVKRLIDRGLELRLTANFGPHTKYYPYLMDTETFTAPLVTADDDQLYPRWWLEGLIRGHRDNPRQISCYRAHRIGFSKAGISPYRTWKQCKTTEPSLLNFATGVSGVIYPPDFLALLKEAGSDFRELCPKADDVWLHVQALRAGMPIRQLYPHPLRFPTIPGSQSTGLFHGNVLEAQNDPQIERTYRPGDLARLRDCELQTKQAELRNPQQEERCVEDHE